MVIISFLICGIFALAKAQSLSLAKNYFDQGEFEKAVFSYSKALKKDPKNQALLLGLVKSYQELEQYDKAEEILLENQNRDRRRGAVMVELGYNYQLQQKDSLAKASYKDAIEMVAQNRTSPYQVGRIFQERSLLEEAVKTYETAMSVNPKSNFDAQLAKIYGELGEIEKMFTSYLDLINRKNYLYRHSST